MTLPYQAGCPNCDAVREFWARIDDKAQAIPGGPTGWHMMALTLDAEDVPQCLEHLNDLEGIPSPENQLREHIRKSIIRPAARAAIREAIRQMNDERAAVHRAMRGTHMNIVAAEESRKLRRRPK